jgi:putative ABC transport system permease protein
MRSTLRQFRRAPGRIIASIFAIALAIGAIGVLSIPSISEGALHEAVARDGLADIIVTTTPLEDHQVDRIAEFPGVVTVEEQSAVAVRIADDFQTTMIGLDFDDQTMDIVQLTAGTLPVAPNEVVAWPGAGAVGDMLVVDGRQYLIAGHGTTLWWADSDVLFAPLSTVTALTSDGGTNRLVVQAADDSEASLRALGDGIRDALEADGDSFTSMPIYLPDGSTPIDADIEQVSRLIGLLGVFAGLVAFVLLASTTNTLVIERTREVAVMRALGGRNGPIRRRLHRIAVGITVVALIVGLPLGVVISNLIARMVLEEFVRITPAVSVNWTVVGLSTVGALLGARLVAAGAARKVVRVPLADALHDRDGDPFGRRRIHRMVTGLPLGSVFGRIATRASVHRPARTAALVVQVAAAVGAAFLIPSLTSSVNAFNDAAYAPWSWESVSVAREPGLPFDVRVAEGLEGAEIGVWTDGEIADRWVAVYGLPVDTHVFDPMLVGGEWIGADGRDAVISRGFAERNDIAVGDAVTVELAVGPRTYDVVGLSNDFATAIYVDRAVLSGDLGAPGRANAVWSDHPIPGSAWDVAVRTTTAAELAADDAAGRAAIVVIFGAIGVIVAGVAALAVMSSMMVSLFERRHEFAALRALGARKRRLHGVVVRELLPIALIGTAAGIVLGGLGTRGIIGSFERSNSIDIGVVDAIGAIPYIIGGTILAVLMLTVVIVRVANRG